MLVANVVAEGPAAKAGLKRNDIIVSFAGQDVLDLRRFRGVADARVGSTVDLVVWRSGKEVPLKLRVGEQEEAEKQNAAAQGGTKKPAEPDQPIVSTVEQLGLTLQKVTDQLREKYGLSDQAKGVVITKVMADQPRRREAASGRRHHPRGRPEAGHHPAGGHRHRGQAAAGQETLGPAVRRTPGRPTLRGAQADEVIAGAFALMFLSPLGERLVRGSIAKIVSCITPSPNLSLKGERSLIGEELER